jgi:hypothetical protein
MVDQFERTDQKEKGNSQNQSDTKASLISLMSYDIELNHKMMHHKYTQNSSSRIYYRSTSATPMHCLQDSTLPWRHQET